MTSSNLPKKFLHFRSPPRPFLASRKKYARASRSVPKNSYRPALYLEFPYPASRNNYAVAFL